MKRNVVATLLLIVLALVGCSQPVAHPKPVVDLTEHKNEFTQVTLNFCYGEEEVLINLADHNYIIPLDKYESSCMSESFTRGDGELAELLWLAEGVQHNLSGLRFSSVTLNVGVPEVGQLFPTPTTPGFGLLVFTDRAGYARFDGPASADAPATLAFIQIQLDFVKGWNMLLTEEDASTRTVRLTTTPINSMDWDFFIFPDS